MRCVERTVSQFPRDIVSMVTNRDQDHPDVSTNLESYTDAATALELAIRYVEKPSTTTQTNAMFMRRWHSIAPSCRFSSLRRKKLTDLILLMKGAVFILRYQFKSFF
ncbi:hypothetical protein AVEN_22468-1 [Araneus ventricosus]|uniref:Uncharacterized protein n=1 Tax=Araneus ventricosus TaxID=182803 RepID=A0A4Y2MIH9_ARAVE|nr:hypothetical protein AVEN_22468-1 [Araneus ventricosus]